MKKIRILVVMFFITKTVNSQTVTIAKASACEGKIVTVCAKVAGTHITKGEKKVIYLNLEKTYPNSPFTIVIFEGSADNFDYNPLEFLKNKSICVTGKVSIYKDKPQIVASKQSQISIQK